MASNEPDKSEKTEPATPHKIREAQKKGSVAKSMDINSVLALAAALIFVLAAGEHFGRSVLNLCRELFLQSASMDYDPQRMLEWGGEIVSQGLFIISPLVALLMLVGVFGTMMQTGPVFSFQPLKPDLKRINPVAGFKRLMTVKLLVELVKSLLKLAAFSMILYFSLKGYMADILGLLQKSPSSVMPFLVDNATAIIFRLLMALVLIALIDLLFVRWDYLRNLRMTRKELKDEIKRREGDPLIRAKRRELEKELRDRAQSMTNVPDADVIVTNPTHYAVAIRYDRGKMLAPEVTAKGTGEMALKIRDLARNNAVPVIESTRLARRLYKTVKINEAVPQDLYMSVAKVLRLAYQRQAERKANARSMRGREVTV